MQQRILNRFLDTIEDDYDKEDMLKVLIAMSVSTMQTMGLRGYVINSNNGNTITLEVKGGALYGNQDDANDGDSN